MSKILEYIKLIPNLIQNREKIVEGIINNTKLNHDKLPEDEVEEIIRRRVICAGCPFLSTNAKNLGIYSGDRTDEFCTACGCDKEWKTACLTCNCGLEAYNARNPKNKLPLKWEIYDKNKLAER